MQQHFQQDNFTLITGASLGIVRALTYECTKNEELRLDNIRVSIVSPGPVITNEEGLKRFKVQGAKAKLIVKMPMQVAKIAIRGMLKNKTIIIPGYVP